MTDASSNEEAKGDESNIVPREGRPEDGRSEEKSDAANAEADHDADGAAMTREGQAREGQTATTWTQDGMRAMEGSSQGVTRETADEDESVYTARATLAIGATPTRGAGRCRKPRASPTI